MTRVVCPLCRGPLAPAQDPKGLRCERDRLDFPLVDGVPLMYLDSDWRSACEPAKPRTALGRSYGRSRLEPTARLILSKVLVPQPREESVALCVDLLNEVESLRANEAPAELRTFERRFGIPDAGRRFRWWPRRTPPKQWGSVAKVVAMNCPARLRQGVATSFNVRILNPGPGWLARTEGQFVYRLLQGERVLRSGSAGRLPVEVAPGGSLSLPVDLNTQDLPVGTYVLECAAASSADNRVAAPFEVAVDDGQLPLSRVANAGDYAAQHVYSKSWLAKHVEAAGLKVRDYLEIGCGCSPCDPEFLGPGVSKTGLEISHLLARLGQHLFDEVYSVPFRFVAGDLLAPPFPESEFDLITMYATFHHLSDPARALNEIHRIARPGALVALMCEPHGSSLHGAETELTMGVDEKVYSIDEYAGFFNPKLYELREIHISGGSLNLLAGARK